MRLKIAYLFTTFPEKSETFLQREMRAMRQLSTDITLFSLRGGSSSFEGLPIRRFSKWKLFILPFACFYQICRKPKTFATALKVLLTTRPTSLLNIAENILGAAFALLYAPEFRKEPFNLIHATWATMPATAALILNKLTQTPFSMGAHAYDVFQHGGDMFLKYKIRHASLIHASTKMVQQHLLKLGADPNKIAMVRRGLHPLPSLELTKKIHSPLRIISIGRLVPKKGFLRQLEIYAYLKKNGVPFEAKIVGSGSLQKKLQKYIEKLGLSREVRLTGWLDFPEIQKAHQWADICLFTGRISECGNRDGLPNVVPEAMASGLPIIASNVAALPEVIAHKDNGLLVIDYDNNDAWLEAFKLIVSDKALYDKVRTQAYIWVKNNFDANKNASVLYQDFLKVAST